MTFPERRYADIQIGEKASVSKTVTDEVVRRFAEVTEDYNPVHVDAEFAAKSLFKERIAHGMLGAGLISAVLGTRLPGPNTIYLGQEMKFLAPVKLGDTITAEVEVVEKIDKPKMLKLKTVVRNQSGTVVIDGLATVKKWEPA
ncbi:MAG: MaoC family dehydratase [Deltaproteobacteria bacterium]|nr:MaoC family dehydratase [Deltaproteobacteria bacterium]